MKQINILQEVGTRVPSGFWKDLANKLIALPKGKGLVVTPTDFCANGFTNFRTSLYHPLRAKNKSLRSKQISKHEVALWVVDREK